MTAVQVHTVLITVNEHSVPIEGPRVSGLDIKDAAIAAGVHIQRDFLLTQEVADGRSKVVGDSDVVTVNKSSRFDAVAGDDNS